MQGTSQHTFTCFRGQPSNKYFACPAASTCCALCLRHGGLAIYEPVRGAWSTMSKFSGSGHALEVFRVCCRSCAGCIQDQSRWCEAVLWYLYNNEEAFGLAASPRAGQHPPRHSKALPVIYLVRALQHSCRCCVRFLKFDEPKASGHFGDPVLHHNLWLAGSIKGSSAKQEHVRVCTAGKHSWADQPGSIPVTGSQGT